MKLWGGRFTKGTDKSVDDFNSSIRFDCRMYKQDIRGSIAHARMLGEQGIITKNESSSICNALEEILSDIENGMVEFENDAEDIHMNVERLLISRIGDVGKKLHTGRSRNDQVALDTRMYIKQEIIEIKSMLVGLEETLLSLAEQNLDTIMPGYTHLQRAQPVTFAHHMMAYFQMLKRDLERLDDCFGRTDFMPLGSGALAGTTYPLDRKMVAEELGFAQITQNSMDSVSDRDYVVELCSCISILMMHLSRLSEEIILWSSHEFNFITLDDAYSTGSSIMPQKKNPDVAELVRGKTGRTIGNLVTLLSMMKSLPLAYNKDMQEDKEAVFDSIDTVKMCLPVFTKMLATIKINKDIMYTAAGLGFTNATDAADYLVKKGVPFRTAHEITGKLVLHCIKKGISIENLPLTELQQFSVHFENDLYNSIRLESCVNYRNILGGPAKDAVTGSIKSGKAFIDSLK